MILVLLCFFGSSFSKPASLKIMIKNPERVSACLRSLCVDSSSTSITVTGQNGRTLMHSHKGEEKDEIDFGEGEEQEKLEKQKGQVSMQKRRTHFKLSLMGL